MKDWYISEYAPIRNYAGEVIGMLSVGILENTYTAIRNRVILSFFGIATAGFLLILGITYYMIHNITRPIGEMVAATRNIIAGRFDQEVRSNSPGEIALLAESFNAMLKSLRQMKGDLEEWGRTLEEKVKQRTEELVAMQARVAQSERLASLGMLAAGVAHEVNNPLGGILALTGLTVEDMTKDDPNRENLEEVIRQTERCRDIVKGLLEFSRQSKGNTEPVDLNKVLAGHAVAGGETGAFLQHQRGLATWTRSCLRVIADRSQFQQVFINILMNAVQAMNERGTITIVTRHNSSRQFRRGGDLRYRPRHTTRTDRPHLRSLLHDQRERPRHGTWLVDRLWNRDHPRRDHFRPERGRQGEYVHHPHAGRGGSQTGGIARFTRPTLPLWRCHSIDRHLSV